MPRIALVSVTFPDAEHAETVARTVIAERLAACCNGAACASLYRWQDMVETAEEVVAQFKTRADRAAALAARIADLHPYDLPAIEWWLAETTDRAAAWVEQSTG